MATIKFIHQFSLSNKKGNTLSHFSNMFKHKNTRKLMNSLNWKIICFLKAYLSIALKSHKDSRHFRFQVPYVHSYPAKIPSQQTSAERLPVFHLVCLLSHLLQKIKGTMGTSTTWLCHTNQEMKLWSQSCCEMGLQTRRLKNVTG